MEEQLKKDILKHLGVYKIMTDTAIKDRSVNFVQRKVLKSMIKELDIIINKLEEL